MQDPPPNRITGQKTHIVKHELQWGYLVWGAVALLLIYIFLFRPSEENDEEVRAGP